MTKKKLNPKRAGRKSKYHPDMHLIVEGLAREGLSEKQIAKAIGVSEQTLNIYKNKYPEFLQSLRAGQAPVDIAVENALLKKCLGYDYDEVIEVERYIGNGRTTLDIKKITRHVPGDVTAQKFWLVNRRRKKWSDKVAVEHGGDITITIDAEDQNL